MDTEAVRKIQVALCVTALLGTCSGFQCYQCSYSYDPAAAGDNQDCIYSPARVSGININHHCDRRCYTQEFYSLEQDRVVSVLRTCNSKNDTDYCIKDASAITCYHSCMSDLCNNIQLPLHETFPIFDSADPKAMDHSNEGFDNLASRFHTTGVIVVVAAAAVVVGGDV